MSTVGNQFWSYSNWKEISFRGKNSKDESWEDSAIVDYSKTLPTDVLHEADQRRDITAYPIYYKKSSTETIYITLVILIGEFLSIGIAYLGVNIFSHHYPDVLSSTAKYWIIATGSVEIGIMIKHAGRAIRLTLETVVRVIFVDWVKALNSPEGQKWARYCQLWRQRVKDMSEAGYSLKTAILTPVYKAFYLAANVVVAIDPSRLWQKDSYNGRRWVKYIETSWNGGTSLIKSRWLTMGKQLKYENYKGRAPTYINGCYQPRGYLLVEKDKNKHVRTWSKQGMELTYKVVEPKIEPGPDYRPSPIVEPL